MAGERPDAIETLLPAYALNALDAEDRDLVERALASEPRYRQQVQEYLDTVGQLVELHPAVTPRTSLRHRVLTSAVGDKSPARTPVGAAGRTQVAGWGDWLGTLLSGRPKALAAAAVFALSIGVLGVFSAYQHQEIQDLRNEVNMLAAEADEAAERLAAQQALAMWAAQPGASTVSMSPVSNVPVEPLGTSSRSMSPQGMVAEAPDGANVLVVMNMRRLPQYSSYQAWAWDMQEQPHSLGVFEVDMYGYAQVLIEYPDHDLEFYAVSVSVEPAGGSVRPSGPTVLSGSIP